VLAIHAPDLRLLERQVESLQAQTSIALRIVAVLDGPETCADPNLRRYLAHPAIEIAACEARNGVRKAFEFGLRHALRHPGSDDCLYAYCDQDDIWHEDKLRLTSDCLMAGKHDLVHCDAQVIDEAGHQIAPSLHRYETRREARNLLDMLLLNTVTGMTSVFTARAARLALSLMSGYSGSLLHDHITAVAAASLGSVGLLDRALVDYVQHRSNEIGAKQRRPAWRWRSIGLAPLAAYRQTSLNLFEERRGLAAGLRREGRLPAALGHMFLAESGTAALGTALAYGGAVAGLLKAGDGRRALLALRMMDAALRRQP